MNKTYTQKEMIDVLMVLGMPLATTYGNMKAAQDGQRSLDLHFINQRVPEIECAFELLGIDVDKMAKNAMKRAESRG